jgi:hypothetical protein
MADDIQSGLDATIPVKANPKGGISPLGTIAMDPTQTGELLKRMQEMVAERESPLSKVLSGLKDFSAAGSGVGTEGPANAILLRDQQKAKEAQELFNMRAQMAELRSAQGQQEQLKRQYEGLNAPQGGAAPAAGGTTAGTSPIPGLTLQQFTAIKNDPYVQSQLETLAPNDYAGRLAIIRDAAKTEFGAASKGKYEAAGNKQEAYTIPGIGKGGGEGTVMMTPNEKIRFDNTGVLPDGTVVPKTTPVTKATTAPTSAVTPTAGTTNLGNMRPVGQSTGFQPPVSVDKDLARIDDNLKAYGDKGINTLSGVISRWAPPSENDTPSLIKNAGQFLGIDPNQKIDLSNPAVRQAISTAIIKQEGNLQKLFASADVTKPVNQSVAQMSAEPPKLRDYPSKAAYDIAMELYKEDQKIDIEKRKKETVTAAEESGKEYGNIGKQKEQAADTIGAANRVIDMSKDPTYSKLMGYFEGGNPAASFLVKALNFGTAKLFGQDEFEKAVAALGFNETERARLQQLKTDASKLGIEYTAQMFKGARLGIGLEKLGSEGKGVSPGFTPETNRLYAEITKRNAEFVISAHNRFRDEWLPKHQGATWGDYLRSAEYDKMLDQHVVEERKLTSGSGVTIKKLNPDEAKSTEEKGGSSFDKYVIKKPK